ncbi:cupin domain-containing protein [Kytococcus schroeteri]|uniref:cupin domain-containing protein n=1 Tax=Kytococcus schroeteri TaxID=138300 RepID=UPI001181BDB5|nr:cupin domain-containing protein [Kytococcus schroeteri]
MSAHPTSAELPVATGVIAGAPIQEGKVRGTTVVSDDHVRTVCFAMDAGTELAEHKAAHRISITVVAGRMRFTVHGEDHEMVAGDVVNLPRMVEHAVLAEEPTHFVLTMHIGA